MEFLDSASPEVYDYDRGSNGTFRMAIENDVTGIFEVIRFKFLSTTNLMHPSLCSPRKSFRLE